ncbi:MAG: hypothetical protein IJ251_01040 [Oscillospiraceae bacterium]|nr:hypothetical protein [Oscillospiraceae bacterium]
MKRTFIIGAAGLALLTGCRFDPWENEPRTVYGPPGEYYETEDVTSGEGSQTSAAAIHDDFDPSENKPVDVYGPPAFEEEVSYDDEGEAVIVVEEEEAESTVDDEELIDDESD